MSDLLSSETADLDDAKESDVLTRLCLEYYETRLKSDLEPSQNGNYVAIHADSMDHLVAHRSGDAMRAMTKEHSRGFILLHRIGPTPVDDPLVTRMMGKHPVSSRR